MLHVIQRDVQPFILPDKIVNECEPLLLEWYLKFKFRHKRLDEMSFYRPLVTVVGTFVWFQIDFCFRIDHGNLARLFFSFGLSFVTTVRVKEVL